MPQAGIEPAILVRRQGFKFRNRRIYMKPDCFYYMKIFIKYKALAR